MKAMGPKLKRDIARQLVDLACMDLDAGHVCAELHSVIRRWVKTGDAGAQLFEYVLWHMDDRANAKGFV